MIDEIGTIKRNMTEKRKKWEKIWTLTRKFWCWQKELEKKSAPGKFYKQSVQNISYFNKEKIFLISKKQKIDEISYYWLKDSQNKKLTKRFQRTESFALNNNFTVWL